MARLRLAIEEHGAGRQLVRVRFWPYAPRGALGIGLLAAAIALMAMVSETDAVTIGLGAVAASLVLRLLYECGAAMGTIKLALTRPLLSGEAWAVENHADSPQPRESLPVGTPID
jgi:hypothetical protein